RSASGGRATGAACQIASMARTGDTAITFFLLGHGGGAAPPGQKGAIRPVLYAIWTALGDRFGRSPAPCWRIGSTGSGPSRAPAAAGARWARQARHPAPAYPPRAPRAPPPVAGHGAPPRREGVAAPVRAPRPARPGCSATGEAPRQAER